MTNVLTDEQKKIRNKVGHNLRTAAVVAQQLVGLGHNSDALINALITTIYAAMERLDRIGSEVVTTIRIAQQADGSWSIYESDGETETEERGNLTASTMLDEITRIVMAASGQAEQPKKVFYTFSGERITGAQLRAGFDKEHATDADTQQATDAACVIGCDGPDNSEWRRVRAMELAISASVDMHIGSLIHAARRIETFLKGEAK